MTDEKKVAEIAKRVTDEFIEGGFRDGQDINNGSCDRWGGEFMLALREAGIKPVGVEAQDICDEGEDEDDRLAGFDLPCHCFVQVEDKYYDAETPQGVDSWTDLPYFQREGAYNNPRFRYIWNVHHKKT
jgi:hypothetical protein